MGKWVIISSKLDIAGKSALFCLVWPKYLGVKVTGAKITQLSEI